MVYSWVDMNPQSDFLKGLFYQPPDFARRRTLPSHTKFQMIYGFQSDENESKPSGDGVLSLDSMTRAEAIEEAEHALPLEYGHTAILHSNEAVSRLEFILGESFD